MNLLCIPEEVQRADLAVFLERVSRLSDAAVVRLRTRADGSIGAWAATGFDVLAGRVVSGTLTPSDITCDAGTLRRELANADPAGCVDLGYPMDSAWRGALPPEAGFVHLDDVPATVLHELARRGAELSREHGAPPVSLLDQEVIRVSGRSGEATVPMRCVLALAAMRFLPEDPSADNVVRVRTSPAWLRVDARFGSVFRHIGGPALLVR